MLSFVGIGDTQTKSQFPRLDSNKAVSVTSIECPTGSIILTRYDYEQNISFVSYEDERGLLFAVAKFESGKYAGVLILRQDKSVVFYEADKIKQTPKVCESLEAITAKINPNTF